VSAAHLLISFALGLGCGTWFMQAVMIPRSGAPGWWLFRVVAAGITAAAFVAEVTR